MSIIVCIFRVSWVILTLAFSGSNQDRRFFIHVQLACGWFDIRSYSLLMVLQTGAEESLSSRFHQQKRVRILHWLQGAYQ
jgi:hypothetical protein